MRAMNQAILGAIALGFWAAGLFFLRFWSKTRDPLFVFFAAAFWMMALGRLGLALQHGAQEPHNLFYFMRFIAFVLILVGIINKNRAGRE